MVAKKRSSKAEKEREEKLKEINKKHNTSIVTFENAGLSNIEWLDSGIEELNAIISNMAEGGGWPKGRFIELFGPEGSGKTWLLSQVYAHCTANGLKALHYDSEGSYSKPFAQMHGVDTEKLDYSEEDCCEKIMEEIESLIESNVYDVIGIDSLAALVPKRVAESDMGKENFSPLALAMSRCFPRVNSALKKSKTVLIMVNQLRDNVGVMYGEAEKTPGGRTTKFHASVRVDVRRKLPKKAERPDMFEGDIAIGHHLKITIKKNKVAAPFRVCTVDLMYKMNRPIIELVKTAMETDIIERNRNKSGELYGKKVSFMGESFSPSKKENYEEIFLWLQARGVLCDLVAAMDEDDFDQYIETKDITEEEVSLFLERMAMEPIAEVAESIDEE